MGLRIFFRSPTFALNPSHSASYGFSWDYVLFEAVSDHKHLFRPKSESFHPKRKYLRVGLADSDNGTFHNLPEIFEQAEVSKHRLNVAVEIGNEYKRINLRKRFDDGSRPFYGCFSRFVTPQSHRFRNSVGLSFRKHTLLHKPTELDAHLDTHQVAEIVVRQYMTCSGELTFSKDISVAELLFGHRHTFFLIRMPYHFTPMVATCIDGAAIIEYYPFYAIKKPVHCFSS